MNDIIRTFKAFMKPGQVSELRALNVPYKHWSKEIREENRSGFFTLDQAEAFAKHAQSISGHGAVYFVPNALTQGFRSHEAFGEFGPLKRGQGCSDEDIERRCWFLIDFDPVRNPATVSSSEEEKRETLALLKTVQARLDGQGWPAPIVGDSGNGYHLNYAIDLPNDDESRDLIKDCLEALHNRFWHSRVKVDQTVFNASRIWKVYGTKAIKGKDTKERPHRMAKLLSVPEKRMIVPREFIVDLANEARSVRRSSPALTGSSWNKARILELLDEGGIDRNQKEFSEKGGPAWTLVICPFIGGCHGGGKPGMNTTMVGLGGDGIPWLRCHGDRCRDRGFLDLVELIRPGHKQAKRERSEAFVRKERKKKARKQAREKTLKMERRDMTDLGNAYRFVDDHEGKAIYIPDWGQWLVWQGHKWERDKLLSVEKMAHETAEKIKAESFEESDEDLSEGLYKHAQRSQSDRAIRAMVNQARPMLAEHHAKLDRDQWVINCLNGTLDLKADVLRQHDHRDLISKAVPANQKASSKCPRWHQFLKEMTDGDQEVIGFLKRFVGYTLTGDVSEEAMLFFYGNGANGKSVFVKTIGHLLGDYSTILAPDLLEITRNDQHPTSVADLYGMRLATSCETERASRLSEKTLKILVSSDLALKARKMRQDFFSFPPTQKLMLAGNYKPRIIGDDDGIWRRILLVHCRIKFEGEKKDKQLDKKLLRELDGIFGWAVEGCLEWQEKGLQAPQSVLDEVKEYRMDEDVVGRFLESCCEVADGLRIEASVIYRSYVEWCKANGEYSLSGTAFGKKLTSKGFGKIKASRVIRTGLTIPEPKTDGTVGIVAGQFDSNYPVHKRYG